MEDRQGWMVEVNSGVSGQGRKRGNKRRFSDDQVRLLEMMFEEETKLEPKKKLQAARELGLQPRQVAIWFQNRRARWKSKHLEREYSLLKANYDALAQTFDSLKKEKQALLKQVKKLSEMLGKEDIRRDSNADSVDTDSSKDGLSSKFAQPEKKLQRSVVEGDGFSLSECSFDESSINCIDSFHPEESGLTAAVNLVDAGVKWPENWAELDSGSFSDQSCSTMDQLWNFWP